jgi:ribose 5-phosphate isomerase B
VTAPAHGEADPGAATDAQSGQAQRPTVLIAADHAGVATKAELSRFVEELGFTVRDLGPHDTTPCDYPGFAHALARAVVAGEGAWGILICGSGIGMSIAANRIAGARAALAHDAYTARMARNHNDANILVLGARVLGPDLLRDCIREFARSPFTPGDDGRHARRVAAIEPDPS